MQPAQMNTSFWLPVHWIVIAASSVRNMPPMPPVIAPRPTTEPATFAGKRSVELVNTFADHAWWQAVARLINATHSSKLCV